MNENADKKNVRYYRMSENTPESIMEDYFASEEEQAIEEKRREGFKEFDPIDIDDEEAWAKIRDEICDQLE